MSNDEDEKLFTCSWCSKVIKENDSFDVVCCELPEEFKKDFIKQEEGRIVNIMVGSKVVPLGVPAKDSEAAMSGADITFMCCSEVCRSTIELILDEAGWIYMDNEES